MQITSIVIELGVIAVITSLSLITTNLVDRENKFKLAFFSNKKPAFYSKKYALGDSRLDIKKLEARWPEVFSDTADENNIEKIWYREIYLPVRDSAIVTSANKQFLIARDCYIGWLFITLITLFLDINLIYDFSDYSLQVSLVFIVLLNLTCRSTGKNLVLNSICESINLKN
ncbi:hypothetical protein [Photobacterium leiognathi]|uniref:hypothetical protein n=1 Tax=Photobacterium leiognathi TaxID=553611 RepID=UPI00273905CF|nr:hypothetical protein [Photobacterium leiognathi]